MSDQTPVTAREETGHPATTDNAAVAVAPAGPIYAILALATTGGTLFTIGIVFYMTDRFGWGLAENFRMAAAQGAVYVAGALLANAVTDRVSHRVAMVGTHALMAVACAAGAAAGLASNLVAVTVVLFAYTFLSAMTWPMLESLLALGTTGSRLSRRLGAYNVVWPFVSFATLAGSGRLIASFPTWVFLLPAVSHAACVWLAYATRSPNIDHAAPPVTDAAPSHLEPEPELLRVRTLALWVSRLALPATYAVIYGLMPLMPSLPAMARLDLTSQTVVSSAWLAARWLTFCALAGTVWWHNRPRVMVWAAVLMLVSFVGVTFAPSQVFGAAVSPTYDLAALLTWQLLLGAALGIIYSGSLYFGMVLGDGGTEHGGYHEALIGLGWVLGPAAGAAMQWLRPGDARAGVAAVGAVIAASVLCVVGASVLARRAGREGSRNDQALMTK